MLLGRMISVGAYKVHQLCCVSKECNYFSGQKQMLISRIFFFVYFLQLVSANLERNDDESNANWGYRENDIKLEIRRASRMVRFKNQNSIKNCVSLINLSIEINFRLAFIAN